MKQRLTTQRFLIGLILALALVAAPLADNRAAVTGSEFYGLIVLLVQWLSACLLGGVLLGFMIYGVLRLARHKNLHAGLQALKFLVALGVCLGASLWLTQNRERARLHEVARLGAPLVHAIESYDSEHGQPPTELRLLVPKYIAKIPTTGLNSDSSFEYSVGGELGRWAISVTIPRMPTIYDRFYYSSGERYPAEYEYAPVQRIDGWALESDYLW